jgi:transcriptional regulator with XRE-family HTH domain
MTRNSEPASVTDVVIGGVALAGSLLFPTGNAFREAKRRGAIPVPLFKVPGRRGWFARQEDVLAWQRGQLPEAGLIALRTAIVQDSGLSYGPLLKSMRLTRQKNQKELALALGIDQSYLAALESGRRKPPKEPLFGQLLAALAATTDERSMLTDASEYYELRRGARRLKRDDRDSIVKLIELLPQLGPEEMRALYEHADGLLLRTRRASMT